MAARKTLRTEVDELRDALDTLRAERAGSVPTSSANKAGSKPDVDAGIAASGDPDGEGHEIEQALKDLADMGEKKITENPALAAGLAFFLGLLIGRLSRI